MPHDYRYTLGDALLVAPVLDETGHRDVELPTGAWYDWWASADDAHAGGAVLRSVDTTDRTRMPLYVRRGAILPLHVDADIPGLGSATAADALTVLVYPDDGTARFTLHENDTPTTLTVDSTATDVTVTLPPSTTSWYLRVRADRPYRDVTLAGSSLPTRTDRAALDGAPTGWWADTAGRFAWVRVTAAAMPRSVRLLR